jgi:hypothetical protein
MALWGYLMEMADNSAFMQYAHPRVFLDVNRVKDEDIMRKIPYRGVRALDPKRIDEAREEMIPALVHPWQRNAMQLVVDNPAAIVVEPHSMDVYEKGYSPLTAKQNGVHGTERKEIRKRPPIMVCEMTDIRPEDHKVYGLEGGPDITDVRLLPKEVIDGVLKILTDKMSKYIPEGEGGAVLDNPYKLNATNKETGERMFTGTLASLLALAGRQLNGKAPIQLVIDVRKDIIRKKAAQRDLAEGILEADMFIRESIKLALAA